MGAFVCLKALAQTALLFLELLDAKEARGYLCTSLPGLLASSSLPLLGGECLSEPVLQANHLLPQNCSRVSKLGGYTRLGHGFLFRTILLCTFLLCPLADCWGALN